MIVILDGGLRESERRCGSVACDITRGYEQSQSGQSVGE